MGSPLKTENTKEDLLDLLDIMDKEMIENFGQIIIPMLFTVTMEEKRGIQVILSQPMEQGKQP